MREEDGFKWLTADQLAGILAALPKGSRVSTNVVRNLSVMDENFNQIGFIDFAEPNGAFESYEGM